MANKRTARHVIGFLKDCDDMVEIITGQRIKNFVKKGLEVYGDDVKQAVEQFVFGRSQEIGSDDPYRVLGCRPDADDLVVKGKYRQLVKKLHPDTGAAPDPKAFQKVVESYNAIVEARKTAKNRPGTR